MDSGALENTLVYLGIPVYSKGFHKIVLASILYDAGITDIDQIYRYIGFLTESTVQDAKQDIQNALQYAHTSPERQASVDYYLGSNQTSVLASISLLCFHLHPRQYTPTQQNKYPHFKRAVVISHHIG